MANVPNKKDCVDNRVVHPGDELSENNRNPGDTLGKFCNFRTVLYFHGRQSSKRKDVISIISAELEKYPFHTLHPW